MKKIATLEGIPRNDELKLTDRASKLMNDVSCPRSFWLELTFSGPISFRILRVTRPTDPQVPRRTATKRPNQRKRRNQRLKKALRWLLQLNHQRRRRRNQLQRPMERLRRGRRWMLRLEMENGCHTVWR